MSPLRPSYQHRITREDVGRRVSVRRWVDDDERGRIPSDVVGRLTAWDSEDVLTIRRRDGESVEVSEAAILASKTIPEPPDKARG